MRDPSDWSGALPDDARHLGRGRHGHGVLGRGALTLDLGMAAGCDRWGRSS